jgi:hypothetical protein
MNRNKCILLYCFDDNLEDAVVYESIQKASSAFESYTGVSYADFYLRNDVYSSIYHGTKILSFSGADMQ